MEKRLYRSRTDRMISGVCGGIAEYFDIDPTIVRLATVALLFVTSGLVVFMYIVMAIVVPEAPVQGEPDSPRAMSGADIATGAQGFARDVQTAATKVVGGVGGQEAPKSPAPEAPGTAEAGKPADGSDAGADVGTRVDGGRPSAEGATPAAPPAASASTADAPQASSPEHPRSTSGAILIGLLLIAFGLLVFVQRAVGVDLWSWAWRLFVPGVIIALGIIILVRGARRG